MRDKSRNTCLCVHWQWNTLEWCQLNALQASPVVHSVTPLSCVSLSMNTQPSVPTIQSIFLYTNHSWYHGIQVCIFLWYEHLKFKCILLDIINSMISKILVQNWSYQQNISEAMFKVFHWRKGLWKCHLQNNHIFFSGLIFNYMWKLSFPNDVQFASYQIRN